MNDLLEEVIEAHGGLERWNQLDKVSARLSQGGALWALKGQPGVLDDVVVTATLHQERVSHHPFGAADRRSCFTPERVSIETDARIELEALEQPRATFAGHSLETPWSTLQLAYFVGTAMWTYLTQPFTFALSGFRTTELEPRNQGRREVAASPRRLAELPRDPQYGTNAVRERRGAPGAPRLRSGNQRRLERGAPPF